MSRNGLAALASALVTAAVILLSRIPAMYIHPLCAFAAKTTLAACAVTVCHSPKLAPGIAYAVAAPVFAWHMDVADGQAAAAYVLAALTLMLIVRNVNLNAWLKAALAALAAAGVLAIYSSVLLTVRHERALYAALTYSFSRQALPCAGLFLGALIGEKLHIRGMGRRNKT